MTKLTIISYIIVAVCIFQTAKATGLLKSPTGFLWDAMQSQISKTIDDVKGLGQEIQNKTEGLANGLVSTQNGFLTSTACTDLRNNVQDAIKNVIKTFDSCFIKKTNSTEIEKLTNAINILLVNTSKNFQDILDCFQNPLNIFQCFSNVKNNVSKLTLVLEDGVSAAHNTIEMFPHIRTCFQTGIRQLSNQLMGKIVQNMGQCVQSRMPSFRL